MFLHLQLTSKEPMTFADLQRDGTRLAAAGVAHGDLVYLLYHFERDVAPAVKRSEYERRPFGALRLLAPYPCSVMKGEVSQVVSLAIL